MYYALLQWVQTLNKIMLVPQIYNRCELILKWVWTKCQWPRMSVASYVSDLVCKRARWTSLDWGARCTRICRRGWPRTLAPGSISPGVGQHNTQRSRKQALQSVSGSSAPPLSRRTPGWEVLYCAAAGSLSSTLRIESSTWTHIQYICPQIIVLITT